MAGLRRQIAGKEAGPKPKKVPISTLPARYAAMFTSMVIGMRPPCGAVWQSLQAAMAFTQVTAAPNLGLFLRGQASYGGIEVAYEGRGRWPGRKKLRYEQTPLRHCWDHAWGRHRQAGERAQEETERGA